MSNKKFQKIVIYAMVIIMLVSTVAMGAMAVMGG
ncbi:MAG: stressosome-associated protein Prli42 [Caryophanon sp.]|nr:stressosome-associated protein Prli42 [Caryophanon sp.]